MLGTDWGLERKDSSSFRKDGSWPCLACGVLTFTILRLAAPLTVSVTGSHILLIVTGKVLCSLLSLGPWS